MAAWTEGRVRAANGRVRSCPLRSASCDGRIWARSEARAVRETPISPGFRDVRSREATAPAAYGARLPRRAGSSGRAADFPLG